jgi:hypothetical protein
LPFEISLDFSFCCLGEQEAYQHRFWDDFIVFSRCSIKQESRFCQTQTNEKSRIVLSLTSFVNGGEESRGRYHEEKTVALAKMQSSFM